VILANKKPLVPVPAVEGRAQAKRLGQPARRPSTTRIVEMLCTGTPSPTSPPLVKSTTRYLII